MTYKISMALNVNCFFMFVLIKIGRAHVYSSHSQISYAVFCLKKKKELVLILADRGYQLSLTLYVSSAYSRCAHISIKHALTQECSSMSSTVHTLAGVHACRQNV